MRGEYLTRTWQYDPTVHAPARYRRACKYHVFLPYPLAGLDTTFATSTVGAVSDAERALQELDAAGSALTPLTRLLLRTESIASSKIEGLHVDARDLARNEARADTGGKLNRTTAEVLANVDAMELAVDEAATVERFTPDEITAIHHRLMTTGPDARIAGRVRSRQNWIGGNDYNPCGADFVPPPPDHVEPLLADLCEAVDDDSFPPLAQAALVHAQFETIHPFDDGNGRTGRALIHVVLRRRRMISGLVPPVSVLLARECDRYIEGLTSYRHGHVDEWMQQFASATARATQLARAYVDEVADWTAWWRSRLADAANPRADAAAWAVIEILPAHPVITAPVAVAATGRAKAAVYAALEQLSEAGVLVPLSGARRNRAWEARGLLDLLADLEAGERPHAGAHRDQRAGSGPVTGSGG